MAAAGLVLAGERGRRFRRPYTLTAAGRAAFGLWIAHEPGPQTIRFPLLLTIGFGRHLPLDRQAAFVRRHRAGQARR